MSDAFGLPTVNEAFKEACQKPLPNAWSHRAVYLARMAVGVTRMHQGDHYAVAAQFRREYESLCKRVRSGEVLPDVCFERVRILTPPDVKEPELTVSRSKEIGDEFLKNIRDGLNAKQHG